MSAAAGAVWRRLRMIATRRQRITILIVLVLSVAAFAYLWPAPRSFAIQVETQSVSITFDGTVASAWRFPAAELCLRLAEPNDSARPGSGSRCDARLFNSRTLAPVEILWPAGTSIQLARNQTGSDVQIVVQAVEAGALSIGDDIVTEDSLLFVPSSAWNEVGTLIYSGKVALGAVPSPGEMGIVLSGTYEIREKLRFQAEPVTVRTGSFFAGDRIDVVAASDFAPVNVYGFIAARKEEDPGFSATIFSPARDAWMRVDRLGAEAALIRPSWVDRALHDPFILAIPTLFGILGYAIASVLFIFPGSTRRSRRA